MPYSRQSFFDPSDSYKNKWSLVPQGRTLSVSGLKTPSLYSEISSAIPIYYMLMFLAIGFDVYLGFGVLSRSGVSIGLIIIGVIADFFLAILPYLLAVGVKNKSLHTIRNENLIFKTLLESKTRKKSEENNNSSYKERVQNNDIQLLKYRGDQNKFKFLKYVFISIIISIAFYKIYTFYSVLPPGFSLFSMAKGKIVVMFSILCAIFHIIGSEKAFAHFMFWSSKQKEYERQMEKKESGSTEEKFLDVDFIGDYKEASSVNTKVIVSEDGQAKIEYKHIIWDDEISELVMRQGDDNAKNGIAIACKETQIF